MHYTPRMVQEIAKQAILNMQRQELLTGIIASTVEWGAFHRPKKPRSPEDFMIHKFDPAPEESDKSDGDRLLELFRSFPPGRVIEVAPQENA